MSQKRFDLSAIFKKPQYGILCAFFALSLGSALDNFRGPLLPIFEEHLGIDYEAAAQLLVWGYVGSFLASTSVSVLLRFFSENALARVFALFPFALVVITPYVNNVWMLSFFGMILGVTINTLGTIANILTLRNCSAESGARWLSGLHAMYGLFSGLGAALIALSQQYFGSWTVAFYAALPLTLPLFFLPRRSALHTTIDAEQIAPTKDRSARRMLLLQLTFCVYVSGEVLTSMWMSAYLVEVRHFTLKETSPYLAGFFAMMFLTRAACFLWANTDGRTSFAMKVGLSVSALGLSLALAGQLWGLALAGCLGPVFPLMLAKTKLEFPRTWQFKTVRLIWSMQVILALLHGAVGSLAKHVGMNISYILPLGFLATALFLVMLAFPKYASGSLANG